MGDSIPNLAVLAVSILVIAVSMSRAARQSRAVQVVLLGVLLASGATWFALRDKAAPAPPASAAALAPDAIPASAVPAAPAAPVPSVPRPPPRRYYDVRIDPPQVASREDHWRDSIRTPVRVSERRIEVRGSAGMEPLPGVVPPTLGSVEWQSGQIEMEQEARRVAEQRLARELQRISAQRDRRISYSVREKLRRLDEAQRGDLARKLVNSPSALRDRVDVAEPGPAGAPRHYVGLQFDIAEERLREALAELRGVSRTSAESAWAPWLSSGLFFAALLIAAYQLLNASTQRRASRTARVPPDSNLASRS